MHLEAKYFFELNTTELYEILKVRAAIFHMEQNIFYQDMDDIDYNSLHCFFMENNKVVAYLRAFSSENDEGVVQIGRVLTSKHGNGVGRALLEQSLPVIKEKMRCKKVIMHSQKHAVGFYEKFGFKTVSDEFIEAGIVHVTMELEV